MTAIRGGDGRGPRLLRLLRPSTLVLVAGLVPLVLAAQTTSTNYRSLWRTRKYVEAGDIWMGVALVVALALGCLLGERLRWGAWRPRVAPDVLAQRSGTAAAVLLRVGLVAYLVLLLLALSRGLGLGMALRALLGDSGALQDTKRILEPVGGVTTFNQLVGPGVALAVFHRRVTGRWFRGIRRLVILGSIACVLRSLLYAERLALLELLVPVAVTMLMTPALAQGRRGASSSPALLRHRRRSVVIPAVLTVVAVLVYPLQEYYRKWLPHYREVYEGSFWSYIKDRLSGYYVTAINNSVMADELGNLPRGAVVLRPLREVPLTGALDLPGSGWTLAPVLGRYGNPEYNSIGGIFAVHADIGVMAFPLLLLVGLLFGKIYARARSTAAPSPVVVLYGTVAVAIIELARVPYLALPRGLVPVLGAHVAVAWALRGPVGRQVRRSSQGSRPRTKASSSAARASHA